MMFQSFLEHQGKSRFHNDRDQHDGDVDHCKLESIMIIIIIIPATITNN